MERSAIRNQLVGSAAIAAAIVIFSGLAALRTEGGEVAAGSYPASLQLEARESRSDGGRCGREGAPCQICFDEEPIDG